MIRKFTVDMDEIVGKLRPRFLKTGRTYTPKKTVKAEKRIRELYQRWYSDDMKDYTGDIGLYVCYVRELPKSAPKRRIGEKDLGKPDIDNVLKLIMDALQGLAYKDDKQITDAAIVKMNRVEHGAGNLINIRIKYGEE